jgi:acyl carrier protein phosphodiesterase
VVLWGLAGLGLLLAVTALMAARRVSRRLDALNQSYWELRYDYTRLRSQLARLDPETPDSEPAAAPQAPQPSVTFVPLSTIRKKDT